MDEYEIKIKVASNGYSITFDSDPYSSFDAHKTISLISTNKQAAIVNISDWLMRELPLCDMEKRKNKIEEQKK